MLITTNTLPKPLFEAQLRSGVKTPPPPQYRVRITHHCLVQGVVFFKGSVLDVVLADWLNLRDSLKAEQVPSETPLFNAPRPPEPHELFPAKIVDLVGMGMTAPKDLASELKTGLGTVLKIAKDLIAEGKLAVNNGVFSLKKA